jgi:hypothetical protein
LIISKFVEKEIGFIAEKLLFPAGSLNKDRFRMQRDPMAGQKNIRLAKKSGESSFPDAVFCRFSPAIPLPPPLFAETRRGERGRFLPALFVFGACFLSGQQENGAEKPTNLEMIQIH